MILNIKAEHWDGREVVVRSVYAGILALVIGVISEAFLGASAYPSDLLGSIGRIVILVLAIYTLHIFSSRSLLSYRGNPKDLTYFTVVLILTILLIWIGRIVSLSLANYSTTATYLKGITASSIYYAIPYATGSLVIQAILGLHFGLIFALSLSMIVGLYSPDSPLFFLYVLVSSLVACLSIVKFRSRSAYLSAGIRISIICLLFAIVSIILENKITVADGTARLLGAFFSAIIASFLAAGVTPIFEYIGGYATDMRLIEIATLDHPLLKELSVQAPGTWNHSMVMGMMAEAAADSIGANSIVARVGAYFHDVGKIKKALYFVENQLGGENRHEKLSTSMSALIIRSHVKDGIELARKHGVPEVIVDMIPQHHGTSLIEYFYDKACNELNEGSEEPQEVDRSLYSYPGPKPQTKEAGILMLADGIEAATRTLTEPTFDRIQGLVQKKINKVFASGELDECELTLTDLHKIAKCFTRVLSGIHHQRIAYSEPAEKVSEKTAEESSPADEISATSEADPNDQSEKKGKESNGEDLKRLGL